jgi:superfamily II DNA or RNA helicase
MVRILVDNSFAKIVGKLHPDPVIEKGIDNALREELGYMPPGVEYSPKFKQGLWDGRISLYRKVGRILPAGLAFKARDTIAEYGVDVVVEDIRPPAVHNLDVETRFEELGMELRWYQEEAAKRVVQRKRGVVALFTGAGKTALTAEIIAQVKVAPVVVIVPSKGLMYQTARAMRKLLKVNGEPPDIGLIGDGKCSVNMHGINVMIYHSGLAAFELAYNKSKDDVEQKQNAGDRERRTTPELKKAFEDAERELDRQVNIHGNPRKGKHEAVKKAKTAYDKAKSKYQSRLSLIDKKQRIREVIGAAQCLILDEAHLAAVVLQTLCEKATNSLYRSSLTATPWREDNQGIRIQAATGKVLIQLGPSDGIELGYSTPVKVYRVRDPNVFQASTYQDVKEKHIYDNWWRNWMIKRLAEEFKSAGRPVLILVDSLDHGDFLESLIQDSLFVSGSDDGDGNSEGADDGDYRKRVLDELEKNKIILIATSWANQGMDAQSLAVVIFADSITSSSTTLQRVGRASRVLGKDINESILRGKPDCVIIDFLPDQPTLREHSNDRAKVFRAERAFEVKIVSAQSGKRDP